MNAMHRALIRLAAISCVVVAHAASASAQTTVRVSVDQSTIWTHDFRSPAAVVQGWIDPDGRRPAQRLV